MGGIGTVVISDRSQTHDYLMRCLTQLEVIGIQPNHIVDDSRHTLGLAGAVNAAWDYATEAGWDYLFHVEEDFLVYDAPLDEMVEALENEQDVAQIVLMRQPVWGLEVELNNQLLAICKEPGSDYQWRLWGTVHHHLFSINPCLIPRRIFERGWPAGNEAEQSDILKAEGWWFGVWGHVEDEPRCWHIGEERAQGWRL